MSAVNLQISGGEGMRRYLAARAEALGGARAVRAGFLENATYPVTPNGSLLHVAQVGFWNEFGTSRAPARPYFRSMIRRELGDWGGKLGAHLVSSDYDTQRAFALMGTEIKDALTNSIASWPADNAPSTVAKKGFNHGLVDKGVMQRSSDFEVLK